MVRDDGNPRDEPSRSVRRAANERGLRALGHEMERHEAAAGAGRPRARSRRQPPPGRRRNGKRRWSTRRKIGTGIAVLLLLVLAVAGAGYGYVRYEWDQVHKTACTTCAVTRSGKPFNVLLIGSDTREGNTGQAAQEFGSGSAVGGQRADTIKILHVDPSAGTARILSIPRDTYVTVSGLPADSDLGHSQKINAAFDGGPNSLIETITNTFGIPINDFVVVNFNGVINSVNALGGIDLRFRYPVRDMECDPDTGECNNNSGLNITQTGCQLLNGSTALALSRSRYYEYYQDGEWEQDPGSDLSRAERQNVIIQAMIAKAKGTYNPLTLHSVVGSLVNDVWVNKTLSLGTIYDLAEQYHAFSPSSLESWLLPTVPQAGTPAGDVELADTSTSDNYMKAITQFLGGSPGPITTPPLDEDGDPISVPSTTTTAPPPPTTAGKHAKGAGKQPTTTAPPVTTTTLPSYDPTFC